MINWIRSRMLPLVALLVALTLVAGCGGAKETVATPDTAAPAAQSCPECPTVDKAAVIADAAKQYFNAIPANSHMVDPKDLKAKLDAKDATIYLLDIRSAADFGKQHIDGFVNMPMNTIGQNLDKLPKDKQILVMCYSGQTSGQTVGVLRMAGFNAATVKFGWKGVDDSKLFTYVTQ